MPSLLSAVLVLNSLTLIPCSDPPDPRDSPDTGTSSDVPDETTTIGLLNKTTIPGSPDETTIVESTIVTIAVESTRETSIVEPQDTTNAADFSKEPLTTPVIVSGKEVTVTGLYFKSSTFNSQNKTTDIISPKESEIVSLRNDTQTDGTPPDMANIAVTKSETRNGTDQHITKPTDDKIATSTPKPISITQSPHEMCLSLYFLIPVKLNECLSNLVVKSSESAAREARQEYFYHTAVKITKFLSPITIIIGTVLNILTFIVLVFSKMRKNSSSLYLATLSVLDTLNLWLNLTRHWIIAVWTLNFRDKHIVLCKLSSFLAYYLPHVSAWIIVAVTIERVVYVCLPLRAKFICTKRHALLALIAIFSIFIIIDGFLFGYPGPYQKKSCSRISHPSHMEFRVKIWPQLDMVLSSLLPFLILLVANVTIIVSCIKAAVWKAKSKATTNTANTFILDKQTISVTLMLLSISFVFIILTLPITVHFYIFGEVVDENPLNYGDIKLSEVITYQIYFINCGINFVLYSISGTLFREQLRILLGLSKSTKGTKGAPSSSSNSQVTANTTGL